MDNALALLILELFLVCWFRFLGCLADWQRLARKIPLDPLGRFVSSRSGSCFWCFDYLKMLDLNCSSGKIKLMMFFLCVCSGRKTGKQAARRIWNSVLSRPTILLPLGWLSWIVSADASRFCNFGVQTLTTLASLYGFRPVNSLLGLLQLSTVVPIRTWWLPSCPVNGLGTTRSSRKFGGLWMARCGCDIRGFPPGFDSNSAACRCSLRCCHCWFWPKIEKK